MGSRKQKRAWNSLAGALTTKAKEVMDADADHFPSEISTVVLDLLKDLPKQAKIRLEAEHQASIASKHMAIDLSICVGLILQIIAEAELTLAAFSLPLILHLSRTKNLPRMSRARKLHRRTKVT
jgi:hypothetical protein